jgi:hypothetical protein
MFAHKIHAHLGFGSDCFASKCRNASQVWGGGNRAGGGGGIRFAHENNAHLGLVRNRLASKNRNAGRNASQDCGRDVRAAMSLRSLAAKYLQGTFASLVYLRAIFTSYICEVKLLQISARNFVAANTLPPIGTAQFNVIEFA